MSLKGTKRAFLAEYGDNKLVDRVYGFTMSPPIKMIVAVYDVKKAKEQIPAFFDFPIEFKQVEKPKVNKTKKPCR